MDKVLAEMTFHNKNFQRGMIEQGETPQPLEDFDFRQKLWSVLESENVIASEQVCNVRNHALVSKSNSQVQRPETCPVYLSSFDTFDIMFSLQ